MRNWFEFFTHIKKIGFNPTTIVDVGVANYKGVKRNNEL